MGNFKPGDVVRSELNDTSFGLIGIVVLDSVDHVGYYLVNFGSNFSGHEAPGNQRDSHRIPIQYKNNHNWYVSQTNLTLVPSVSTTKPTETKGESKMNIDFEKIGKDVVSDNIQFAKFEAERKIGQAALDLSIDAFVKQFPSFKNTADTNIGKLAIANVVRVLGNQYSGKNKVAVDTFTTAVMRGSYATCSDAIDLEKMFDGIVDKFKSIVPGLGSESESSESK